MGKFDVVAQERRRRELRTLPRNVEASDMIVGSDSSAVQGYSRCTRLRCGEEPPRQMQLEDVIAVDVYMYLSWAGIK